MRREQKLVPCVCKGGCHISICITPNHYPLSGISPPPPIDLGIAKVSQGSCGCFSEAQGISPPEKKGLSNLLSPRFAQSLLPRKAMPCKSFLINGTETDLEKQLPLCNEKKSPPAYSFSFLAGVLWKQSKKWNLPQRRLQGWHKHTRMVHGMHGLHSAHALAGCLLLPWTSHGNRNRVNGKFPVSPQPERAVSWACLALLYLLSLHLQMGHQNQSYSCSTGEHSKSPAGIQ